MYLSLNKLHNTWDYARVDGNQTIKHLPLEKQRAIIKGDAKSASIAAASVVAKVVRDHLMRFYDKRYPEYGFAQHKGYPTVFHREQVSKYGLTPIHRQTFCSRLVDQTSLFDV